MKSWWLWKWWNNTIKYHSQQHKIDWLQLEPLIPFFEIYSVRTWFPEPKVTKQALVYLITGMLEVTNTKHDNTASDLDLTYTAP